MPVRYFSELAHFNLIGNPGNDASPPQLPSVHHDPSCDIYLVLLQELQVQ